MSNPLFSVIIPAHNEEKYIRKALDSVREQTFTDYELIVVCDACTDKTAEIAAEYGAKIVNVNFYREGPTRNAGLDAATGEWILFLDADDWFLHEYAFQFLAENVGNYDEDVLEFSFVWKGKGYMVPSIDESFGMAWSQAWRRSFIGNQRFGNQAYGTDEEFYDRLVKRNPNSKRAFLNIPILYYNYMRKGSMTDLRDTKVQMDIIVTHYDEPWETCKPFFDMIQLQRGALLQKVNIILVQDGKENALDWKELLLQYSFKVKVLTIEHSGAATARNVGIKYAQGDWIMFCDIDDMFCDACALAMILDLLPTDECDIIWGKYVIEMIWRKGKPYLQTVDNVNFMNTTCKLYSRQFLEEKHIRFNPQIPIQYEYAFNALCLTETPPFRIRRLTTDFFPYYKTYRRGSMRTTLDFYRHAVPLLSDANLVLANELKARGHDDDAAHYAARAFCLNYYSIHDPILGDFLGTLDSKSAELYKTYGSMVESVSDTDLEVIRDETEAMVMHYIQRLFNEYNKEYYLFNDKLTFTQWLEKISNSSSKVQTEEPQAISPVKPDQEEPTPVPVKPHIVHSSDEPRIVVYCGTRNVYEEMVTSLKSLMYHTYIDRVYFLIEDDTFPYDLPDCVATINVSNQEFFPEDGPNFDNSWTYMCMMRAAYPEMFRQYDKVLSLDLDIIVQDDISDLWDYDLTDYFLAGVPEKQRQKTEEDPIYINFGVVMMNLKKLRQENKQAEIIEVLNRKKVDCPEQTSYNEACAGHILPLSPDYNSTVYSHITGKAERERVLHYAGQTFWKHYANVKQYSDLTWDDIKKKQNELKGELSNEI